jgi:hypothetical protein
MAATPTSYVWAPVAILTLGLAACSSTGGEAPALTLPAMPSLPSVASIGAGAEERPVGSATELYSRVARGAVACWFGAAGPLKKDYIYHAEADAPSRGGKAEIIIHQRDLAQPNPRGAKAFRVNIEPVGETATVQTENLKMPEPMGAAMTADVGRWSKGDQGCVGASTAAGWTIPPAAAVATAPAIAKPKLKKTAAKAPAKKP